MALTQAQLVKMDITQMWEAYEKLKIDRDSFDQLTLQLSTTVHKIDKMEEKVQKLTDELAISKNVNSVLKNSVTMLQRKMNNAEQYGRRENVEVSGVPHNAQNLEEKLIALLKKIDVNVKPSDIAACHPLKREGTAIIRFVNRKNADLALKNSKRLKNLDNSDVWGKRCVNFINSNLSPANLKLRWQWKVLKAKQLIHSFGVDTRGVWLKKSENQPKKRIEIEADLDIFLPGDVSFETFYNN